MVNYSDREDFRKIINTYVRQTSGALAVGHSYFNDGVWEPIVRRGRASGHTTSR